MEQGRQRPWRGRLRPRIVVALLLLVAPIAVLGVASYLVARDSLLDSAQTQVQAEAELRAQEIEGRLRIAHDEIGSIAEWGQLVLPVVEGRLDAEPDALAEPLDAALTWWGQTQGLAVLDAEQTVVDGPTPWPSAPTVPAIGDGTGPWATLLDAESVQLTHRLGASDHFLQATVPVEFVFDGPVPGGEPVPADPVIGSATVEGLGAAVTVTRGEAEVLDGLGPLRWLAVGTVLLTLFLAAAVAWWLMRRLIRRVEALTAATGALGDGDWSRRVGDGRSDEIGELADAVDRMAASIESDQQRRRQVEDQLAYQALHDPLTGLANRAKFTDRLGDALARSRRSGAPVAVLFCDLDNLKTVNDELGHHAGDDLLTGIAERFRGSIRPSDTVARFGGDEFVVLCAEMAAPEDAVVVAERLIAAMARPFNIHGQAVTSSASIGIAVGSGASTRGEELLADADAAMYAAKRGGKARYVVHSESLDDRAARRAAEARDAKRAIERSELRLVFQPVLAIADGELLSTEAFLRWQHPERGTLHPAEVLPQFADAGLLIELDAWVVDRAAAQLDHWNSIRAESPPMRVSLNLSRAMLGSPDLAAVVEKAVAEHRISPSQLCFEIAESTLSADPSSATRALDSLRALGCGVAIDDFGTGHTTIERLRRYGADHVKIDGALVADLGRDVDDAAARIGALTSMAAGIGIDAVAEGVERIEQIPELISLGCRYAQGQLFCAPLDDVGVVRWIERIERDGRIEPT